MIISEVRAASARCHLSTPSLLTAYASRRFAGRGVSRNLSLQNPTGPLLADDHSVTCNHLASGDRHHRPSGNLEALPRSVVGTMMQVLLSDRLATVRIPQRDIGRRTHPPKTPLGGKAGLSWRDYKRLIPQPCSAKFCPPKRLPKTESAAAFRSLECHSGPSETTSCL